MNIKSKKAIVMRTAAIMTISGFVLLMAIPGVLAGTTYYVSTTGQEASVTSGNPENVTAGANWWTLINNGYSMSDGDTLTMNVDGGSEQTVTFNTSEFSDITKARASEIVAVINSETTGLSAYVSPPGDQCSGEPNPKKVSIRSDTPSGSIHVTGGTANAADKLDFDTNVHSGNAGTSQASPWRTIRHAVIMASSGDEIQVAAGTYYEAVNIVGKHNITVAGEDKDTTIINGSGQHASQSGSPNVTYEICPTAPIFLQNSTNVTVQGFTIQKSEAWGVIYMNDADNCTITDNIVKRDCWMFSGSTDYTDYDPDARVSPGYGIYLFKNNENNTISNNIVHGAPASETYGYEPLDHADRGIFLYKFSWNPVEDQNDANEISNSEVYNFRVNIRVCRADDNVIRDNYIHHARDNSWGWNGSGLQIFSYGDSNSPTNDTKVYNNTIVCSNVGDGNAQDTGQNTVWDDGTSKGNCWDDYTGVDANGDGIGDTPYGPIPTANTFDNYPIVTTEIWVDDDWTGSSIGNIVDGHTFGVDAFATIQEGIEVVSGSIVHVAAGAYNEYLYITKDNLTVEGAGINQSIIDLDGLVPYWHYGMLTSSYAGRGGVSIDGYQNTGGTSDLVENVTFKGFTVKNAGVNYPNITGTHTGANNATNLTDNTKSWIDNELVGDWLVNLNDYTDNSGGRQFSKYEITANNATTVTATYEHGHNDNEKDWDTGDMYVIIPYEHWYDQQFDGRDDVRGIRIVSGRNITIENCKVQNCGGMAISFGKSRFSPKLPSEELTICDCVISDNHGNGISIGDTKGTVTITNNSVSNSSQPIGNLPGKDLYDHKTGVSIKGRSNSLLLAGIISGNNVSDNQYIGINVGRYTDGFTVENNTVTGHNNHWEGAGIFVTTGWGFSNTCQNHIVRNNNVTIGNIRGIIAYYAWDSIFENNNVSTDSGTFDPGQAAIKIDHAYNITVKENKVSCDGLGIELTTSDTHDCNITNNTIDGAMFAGVYIRSGAYSNSVSCNAITNTTSDTFTFRADEGTHDGGDDQSMLTDTTKSWTPNAFVGFTVRNLDDGSSGTITANTATTVTATLSGGTENDWDDGDDYDITYNETRAAGIYLRMGNDSKLYNNDIKYNDDYGIKMYNSTGNCVCMNNIIDNNATPQAWDNGNNHWNSTVDRYYYSQTSNTNYTGNNWSDYTGSDANGDGIGDIPYNIGGGTGKDYYPLMHMRESYLSNECGDVDGSGFVTGYDSYLVNIGNISCKWAADADCSGFITGYDAYLVNIGSLNCCNNCCE